MNPAKSKFQRGCETAKTIARKGAWALMMCLRIGTAVLWLAKAVGIDAAASPALTVLTAVIKLGKNLTGHHN